MALPIEARRTVSRKVASRFGLSWHGIAKVIVPRIGRALAKWRPRIPRAVFDPHAGVLLIGDARRVRIGAGDDLIVLDAPWLLDARPIHRVARRITAHALVSDILRLPLIVAAETDVVGEDCNVAPWRWVPVRVVITLLWALKPAAVPVGILAGIDGVLPIPPEILIGV